jgi:hypothetical protein
MRMSDVVQLCTELCIKATPGPEGVEFSWFFDSPGQDGRTGSYRYRIRSGSGIAGRGHAWGLVELPAGPSQPKVTTRRALKRQLLEAIVEGQRPEPREGFEVYARWHTYGWTSSVQWFRRRRRAGAR